MNVFDGKSVGVDVEKGNEKQAVELKETGMKLDQWYERL